METPLETAARWFNKMEPNNSDQQWFNAAILSHLEALEASKETPASESSSAPTTGPAEKLSGWSTETVVVDGENLLDAPAWLRVAIMDSFKFTLPLTDLDLQAQTKFCLTLQLMWPSPTPSGENKVGDLGAVVLDDSTASRSQESSDWERSPGITEEGLSPWVYTTTPAGDEYITGPDGFAWRYRMLARYLCDLFAGYPRWRSWPTKAEVQE